MNPFADFLPGWNVLLAFVNLLILLMTFYMGLRFIKRTTVMTTAVFVFQLCILTAGILAFVSKTYLVPLFEIALVLLGIVFPSAFLLHDYLSMRRRINESGSAEPLIRKLEKDGRPMKYGFFTDEAMDWGEEASADMVSASLSLTDKPVKKQFMGQIRAAHKLIEKGKLQEALVSYRILAGIAHDNPCAVYNTAWLYKKLGQYEKSLRLYRKALDLLGRKPSNKNGESPEEEDGGKTAWYNHELHAMAHFGYGICCYALKKYELSIIHFGKALECAPDLREADINIAKAYLALERFEEAEEYIRSALEKKDDVRLRYLIAVICFEKNRDMECKYHLERIIESHDDFIRAWDLLGKVCRKTGDWKGAETAYRKLIQTLPQDADAYYRLGVAQRQEGKTEEALSSFKTAAEINPGHSRALYSMASILDARGKYDKAIDCLKKSLDGDEKLEMAYNLLADIYISRDQVFDAIRVYEEASTVHPGSYIIHYNLGVTMMMARHYEGAVQAFKRARKITADDPALYYNWASAAIALKNYSEAARLYKEGLRFKPDDDEMLYGLARISALSGDVDAAIAFLSQCLRINPGMKLRARASHDFASLRTVKEFRKITSFPRKEA
ncbi:MAG: tetratricopeptide repeat protein [Clostridiaceae bacterium]|jgi:tetratricopeptide (TPR) repeat protein|nr:tetratricopeptide repeat protein [Clostridiaceae bacterium]